MKLACLNAMRTVTWTETPKPRLDFTIHPQGLDWIGLPQGAITLRAFIRVHIRATHLGGPIFY